MKSIASVCTAASASTSNSPLTGAPWAYVARTKQTHNRKTMRITGNATASPTVRPWDLEDKAAGNGVRFREPNLDFL